MKPCVMLTLYAHSREVRGKRGAFLRSVIDENHGRLSKIFVCCAFASSRFFEEKANGGYVVTKCGGAA
ncbi:MAG: hypothetical protein EGQ84_02090 [Slackia sp.]|nr:hypothetical protein [Slackia sp.]